MKLRIVHSTLLLALVAATPATQAAPEQSAPPHAPAHRIPDFGRHGDGLIAAVREATRRFKDTSVARAEGYQLHFGCVSGPDEGAMGLHLANGALIADGVLNVAQPELLLYEPTRRGGMRLTGADYLVFAEAWDASHDGPPQLMGQLFHLFDSPNRFALPAFYTLHVWAWKPNPRGNFSNWNPRVSCDHFVPDAGTPH